MTEAERELLLVMARCLDWMLKSSGNPSRALCDAIDKVEEENETPQAPS